MEDQIRFEEKKYQKLQQVVEKDFMKSEATFQPQICPASKKMVSEKQAQDSPDSNSSPTKAFDRLHQ